MKREARCEGAERKEKNGRERKFVRWRVRGKKKGAVLRGKGPSTEVFAGSFRRERGGGKGWTGRVEKNT